ncbi:MULTISPECIES: HAMP domain-containing protein [Okeania]|nr:MULTISPECIES: cache domain-containing protein [Okeania]NES91450.1 HAMP domain-containing protein [Okeania sp. SIO2B9]RQH13829.1 HAMP domain-containing protein [Okeania hirsuta]
MPTQYLDSSNKNKYRKASLRKVFVLPIVLQIMFAVGLTGWLSLRNGQKAVNNVASQLLNGVTTRVDEHLESYLKIPPLINQVNRDAIRINNLDAEKLWDWQQYLFKQMQLFPNISSISFGSTEGEVVWLIRLEDQSLQLGISDYLTAGNLEQYTLDRQGNIIQPRIESFPYDPRNRPWYQAVIEAGNPTWTKIYPWIDGDNFGISNGLPYYDEKGIRKGVLSVDLTLDKISQFLTKLKIGKSGKVFIVERSGLIVATSISEELFMTPGNEQNLQRLPALESNVPVIQASAQYLQKTFFGLTKINQSQQLSFKFNNQRHFLEIKPVKYGLGIDWIIVVVVPEADFMEEINIQRRNTILLWLAALGLAILGGILTSRWVIQPIISLNKAARDFTQGNWQQKVDIKHSDELG